MIQPNKRTLTRGSIGIAALAGVVFTLAAGAKAQDAEPFTLEGETIRVLVSSAAGGNTDQQTRLLMEFMESHLPGSPTIVVQNVTGGSGVRMLEFIQQTDPADDLIIYNVSSSMPFRSLAGTIDLELFDPRTANWVGNFRGTTQFCIVSPQSGVETAEDFRDNELLFAATSVGGTAAAVYRLLAQQLGFDITIVAGYDSFGAQTLAVQRGEVDGMCNNYSAYQALVRPTVEAGDARFVFYLGPEGARADITDAPYLGDLLPDESLGFFNSALSAVLFGGPYAIPPGSDPQFVAAVQEAFAAVVADPEFQEAAEAYGVDLQYESPEELAARVEALFAISPESIEQIGQFFGE